MATQQFDSILQHSRPSLTGVAQVTSNGVATLDHGAVGTHGDVIVRVHSVWAGRKHGRYPPQKRAAHERAHVQTNPTDAACAQKRHDEQLSKNRR